MPPAMPSTCPLRVSRHTCSIVNLHTSSHGAASRTITGKNTNTHAALLPSCTVAAEQTVRRHHSSSVALEGGVDNSKRCVRLCRCHVLWSSIHVDVYHTVSFTTPMPAACTVPWSGDAVCSYSTPLAHPRRHTCFVSLALAELRVCKGLGVVCLRMVRVVYQIPPLLCT